MPTCVKCGGGLVCPKCAPVIEHTNAIIVRYKDTAYNHGYPNALIIAPLYVKDSGHKVSVATLVGDNFFGGRTFYDSQSVEGMAHFLAGCSIDAFMQIFDLRRSQKQAAKDLLESLRGYLNSQK
jgi:hypothetical protein